ncbi:ankyrin repeat-containing protein At5g02620-like [Hordeum vulgare subsp. vulgare]|uniref:PGG domain-containing protein n=1 Tax=Hordeum vulgare subsp. vulgare TaxID=112509 RepID=A0A8I7BDN3_HORVV|nr:ankyrin repeat-containing protein At5g02620-like [Hordeum vulgare subsp. vulgare]
MQASESPKEAKLEVQHHQPELLMAARTGNLDELRLILGRDNTTVTPVVLEPVVTIDIERVDMDVERVATLEMDSILHVVAASGDSPKFLNCASMIHEKAKHLLDARNSNGDTPFHCAARAGGVNMLTHLIGLARADGDDARVTGVLRKQNKKGETALHEALRLADKEILKNMVCILMQEDTELACLPHANDTSPLYLAVSLGHDDIAYVLHLKNNKLSYSGPHGQNALHVAVLRGKEITKKLLDWNTHLTKQADQCTGSTPLHIAISWGSQSKDVIKLLLTHNKTAAFQRDNSGLFPIHVAAMRRSWSTLRVLLDKVPECVGLRDGNGQTFLHVAIEKEHPLVVGSWCHHKSIINVQDNHGNSPLHLAAKVGNQWIFYLLIQNPQVQLDLVNNEGQTPLDIAWTKMPQGLNFLLNPRNRIYLLLKGAGAKTAAYRCDLFLKEHIPLIDIKLEEKKISDSTQIIGIGSVLIVTVAFAAAFTLPGGFRTDDLKGKHGTAGIAMLAGKPVFHAFIIANTLALVSSALATMNVMFAGVTAVDIRTRMSAFIISIVFVYCSAKSLAAAFVFGLYVVLAPAAPKIAYISCAIVAPFLFLDVVWFIFMVAIGEVMLLKRLGFKAWLRNFNFSRLPVKQPTISG